MRIQISEECLYLQISRHCKWGRAENHTCENRHQQFCCVCLDPHEDVSLDGDFLWLRCWKQRFYPTLLILWWCEGIKSLQCLNSDLLLSTLRDWVCISCCWFPWQFGIYPSIRFHFKPCNKRCYPLLFVQSQIPSLITKHILTLA